MRSTSEPAYSTSTGPDPVAEEDGELLAAEAGAAAEEEEEDELLQPAAASPMQAMPSSAANRVPDEERNEVSIPRP
jgi:hypothetical protein